MPVSASTVQFSYIGDGVTTAFSFPSRFLTAADILVGVNGAQVLSGFAVSGAGNDAGGTVTFSVAPANGATVTLIRAPAINQLLDFVNNQTVLAENIDNGLDKLTIVAQYLSYLLDRTIRLSQFDTTLTGDFDLGNKRIKNSAAPLDANDLARLADVQSVVASAGNVPSPTAGQIGYRLQALAAGLFGWVAAGAVAAPDGSLAAPGINFGSELSTGFLRPSAGVLQTAILGVLKAELTATQLRTLVPLVQPMATAVTAGTNAQGQGPLTNVLNVVTTTAANPSGVTLPTPVAGQTIRVVNRGTNPINLYPASGGTVGALALNAPLSLPVGAAVDLFARTTTQWEGSLPILAQLSGAGGVTVAEVAAATLVTAADTIASNNNDTTIPTSAAVFSHARAVGRTLLAAKTASASATLDFTEFNNAVYRRYEFEFEFLLPATDAAILWMRTSTNGGSSYDAGASDYSYFNHGGSAAGGGIGPGGIESTTQIVLTGNVGNAANEFGVSGDLTLIGAANASVWTKVKGSLVYTNALGESTYNDAAGMRKSAADVDAVRFLYSTGNITSGTIRMYGVI